MSISIDDPALTTRLAFTAETLERFEGAWVPRRGRVALGHDMARGPIDPTLDCASVNCGESDDCESIKICSKYDCTGCHNSCSCM